MGTTTDEDRREPVEDERELHLAIAAIESMVREGRSEREIVRTLRERLAA
jgi:hypothetical protein